MSLRSAPFLFGPFLAVPDGLFYHLPVDQTDLPFTVDEYAALWRDWGIELSVPNPVVSGPANSPVIIMFVSEASGEDPKGRAGELLAKIIDAMGLKRSDVSLSDVANCRAEIERISPRLIVALGDNASLSLTGRSGQLDSTRGRFHPLVWNAAIPVMPTYHPAYLLRNPGAKRIVWDDMKLVIAKLGESR